jgi:maleate isomerase
VTDAVGFRGTIGVVLSSPNTVLERDLWTAAPPGYTFHAARLLTGARPLHTDDAIAAVQADLAAALDAATAQVRSLDPDHAIVGMSLAPFEGGRAGHDAFVQRLETALGCPVSTAAGAVAAALSALGVESVALLTPLGGRAAQVMAAYFTEAGFAVREVAELAFATPRAIAQAPRGHVSSALHRLGAAGADAVVQLGTNLPALDAVETIEDLLGTPVVGVNGALLWDALRALGDRSAVHGYGRLLREH